MAKIYIKFNSAVIREVNLEKDVTTFGRKEGNDIIIDNPAISGFHGKIIQDQNQFFIEDLNSTNGTYINGERIKRAPLKNRDQVSIARHVLEFITDSSAPTLAEQLSEISEREIPETKLNKLQKEPAVVAQPPAATEAADQGDVPLKKEPAGLTTNPVQAGKPPIPKIDAVLSSPPPIQTASAGHIKILYGGDGQSDIDLKDIVTYIGSADQAAIKLRGLMAPSIAVAISKRTEGFFLKAVKQGYVKVDGKIVQDQVFLEHGAQIELGGMTLLFQDPNHKKPISGTKSAPK